MRFQVPQFIEVEDKVIGPLTFKQFLYLAGGAGLVFLLYTFLPLLIALPLIVAGGALAGALAFYKVNNKPFVYFLESTIRYTLNKKLYIWKKVPKKPEARGAEKGEMPGEIYVPRLSDSKLKDLAWSLDVHDQSDK